MIFLQGIIARIGGPLIAYGLIALITGGVFIGWSVHQYNKGWYAHAAAQAAQDKEAVDAVNKAINRIDACRSAGGVWSQSSGDCQKR